MQRFNLAPSIETKKEKPLDEILEDLAGGFATLRRWWEMWREGRAKQKLNRTMAVAIGEGGGHNATNGR